MRKLFYLLIAMLVLMSCGNGSKKKNEENKAEEIQPNRIEVLYFHGAQRCITCRAIEANTVALLDSLYSQEKANGKIIYKVVDISKKENEAIADKYEVTWSSLFVNGWKDGDLNISGLAGNTDAADIPDTSGGADITNIVYIDTEHTYYSTYWGSNTSNAGTSHLLRGQQQSSDPADSRLQRPHRHRRARRTCALQWRSGPPQRHGNPRFPRRSPDSRQGRKP